jgi:hypothetical protein
LPYGFLCLQWFYYDCHHCCHCHLYYLGAVEQVVYEAHSVLCSNTALSWGY